MKGDERRGKKRKEDERLREERKVRTF